MIKNERQYRITKAQAAKFEAALKGMSPSARDKLMELEQRAMQSQWEEMQTELAEYEKLQSGAYGAISVESFDELPRALVRARIASGLSQKDLADKLNLKEQQVQRYEATEYSAASLARIQEIVRALGIKVAKEISFDLGLDWPALLKRLSTAGLDPEFLRRRILFPTYTTQPTGEHESSDGAMRDALARMKRVFDWSPTEIFSSEPLGFHTEALGLARFKLPQRVDSRRLSGYTVYAHYLALQVLAATPTLRKDTIPSDPVHFRERVSMEYGSFSFENIIKFAWALGIPVLPLNDPGLFHGAYWRVGGRSVVVLKQRARSVSRWIFDFLHEIYHAIQEPDATERAVIEDSEFGIQASENEEEIAANEFAGDVILEGRAAELAAMCVSAARGQVHRLKESARMVAATEDVDLGALANYLAFRLSLQDINWWGAARNLQAADDSPWVIARDWLIARLDWDQLNQIDRAILLQALTGPEV
jgi:ribosome-binding protein aMBF1 (putative translation factor)